MGLLSALGRGLGAIGRGASYLRRQRFGLTPELEASMRDSYLAALKRDEEDRAWKREEVIGRQMDRESRREELRRDREEREAAKKLAATARALDILPGMLNADIGPTQPPDVGQLSRLTGADEASILDALAVTERRLSGERQTKAAEKKAKAAEEAEKNRREFEEDLKRIGAQQEAQIKTHKDLAEWDAAQPVKPKPANEFTFEEALRAAPQVNPTTLVPMTPAERSDFARNLMKEAGQFKNEQAAIGSSRAIGAPLDALIEAIRAGQAGGGSPAGGPPTGPPPDWTGHGVLFNGQPVPFSKLPPAAQAKAAAKWTGR